MRLALILLFAFVAQANSALRVRFVNPDNTCGANNGLSIGTGYCDLKEAEAKEQTDLVAAGDSLHIWLHHGTTVLTATSATTISGYTTSATSSITVRAHPESLHKGTYTITGVYNWRGNNTGLTIADGWVEIDGAVITGSATTTNNPAGISIGNVDVNSNVTIKNSIIRTIDQGDDIEGYGIIDQTANTHYTRIINCLIYFPTAPVGNLNQDGSIGFPIGMMLASAGTTAYVYNTLFSSGVFKGLDSTAGSYVVKNTIIQNSLNNAFDGVCESSSTDNTSDDATTCGAAGRTNKTIDFVNASAQDWHLATTAISVSSCPSLSTDSVHPFADDIGGGTRSVSSGQALWDCGCDEIGTDWATVAGGGGGGGGDSPAGSPSQIKFLDYIIESKSSKPEDSRARTTQ